MSEGGAENHRRISSGGEAENDSVDDEDRFSACIDAPGECDPLRRTEDSTETVGQADRFLTDFKTPRMTEYSEGEEEEADNASSMLLARAEEALERHESKPTMEARESRPKKADDGSKCEVSARSALPIGRISEEGSLLTQGGGEPSFSESPSPPVLPALLHYGRDSSTKLFFSREDEDDLVGLKKRGLVSSFPDQLGEGIAKAQSLTTTRDVPKRKGERLWISRRRPLWALSFFFLLLALGIGFFFFSTTPPSTSTTTRNPFFRSLTRSLILLRPFSSVYQTLRCMYTWVTRYVFGLPHRIYSFYVRHYDPSPLRSFSVACFEEDLPGPLKRFNSTSPFHPLILQAIGFLTTVRHAFAWPGQPLLPTCETPLLPSYDFVIVGAGTAGAVLAGRLSSLQLLHSKSQPTVLLIEAGSLPDLRVLSPHVIPLMTLDNQRSAIDWHYTTQPQARACKVRRNSSAVHSKKEPVSRLAFRFLRTWPRTSLRPIQAH